MMTAIIQQHTSDNYYVVLEQNKDGTYVVRACPKVCNDLYGHAVRSAVYSPCELLKAKATFRRYRSKYV